MRHTSLGELASALRTMTAIKDAISVIFVEDEALLNETLRHHIACGFSQIVLIDAVGGNLPDIQDDPVHVLPLAFRGPGDLAAILNQLAAALEKRWIYFCYNGEFLFYPHSETRTIADVTTFMEEERRHAVFTYAVDLYTNDLARDPSGVSFEHACLDSSGYFGAQKFDGSLPLDRQIEVSGGLKWRFGEHIPWSARHLDRISLFCAGKDTVLTPELRFTDPEMNTISCAWHNNLTIAIASFRTAKGLMRNPDSRRAIHSFQAPQSVPFSWSSQQLMELGFMEPGQWF